MVQPVTSERGALHTARVIRMFRERLRLVEAERDCLVGMIDELTTVLFDYRQGTRTASGKVLSEQDINALADEAERGYNVEQLREGKHRRE